MSVDASKFPPLSVCGIGDVQGLLGANCRHSIGPGDGRFNPYEGLYDSEENRIREEQEQKQRKQERAIRQTKREVQGAKAAMDAATDPADKAELKADYQKKALKLQEQNKAYRAYCDETGLKTQDERLHVAGWDRKQAAAASGAARSAAKAAERAEESSDGGLGRRGRNQGVFASLPERMSKKHIRSIAKEYGISLKGIKLNILADEDLLAPTIPYSGWADAVDVGTIDFFPKAFVSKEELTRTLFHEKIHVDQFREYGAKFVQNNRSYFERLAYAAENEFIDRLRKEGKL